MYAESKKAIYAPLEESPLFWKNLQDPRKMGYQRNEYYWSVTNKIVKGKQCIILWHVDELNVLHVDSDIVSSVLAEIDT